MEVFRLMGRIAVDNEKANKEIDETKEKADGLYGTFKQISDKTVKFGNNMLKAGSVIGTAWVASVEGSREYRTEMGKLNTAFETAGYTTQTAAAAYKTLFGAIGQVDQSVEAAQQIALLAESEKDVAEWSMLAAGVVGRFGDALQPETFFESANETLKLCEATGAYVQMLEGMGMSVDNFNAGMAACNTETERQAYMLSMTKALLGDASKAYYENNKDIVDSNRAHSNLTDNIAKLGEMSEPVLTKLIDGVNQMAEVALPRLESAMQWMRDNGEVTAAAIGAIATSMAVAAIAAHPYAAAVTAIVAALALMKERNADGDAYNHFFNGYTNEELETLQRYVEAAREAQKAEAALYDALDNGADTTAADNALAQAQTRRDAAYAEANAIDGLIAAYDSWRTGQENGLEYLDVPLRVSEDSENKMQSSIDGMTFEGVVKMYADTSNLNTLYSIASGNGINGSHASGLDEVPFDGYIARLHKGEAVLNSTNAEAWRSGGMGNTGRLESMMTQLISLTQQLVSSSGKQIVLDSGVLVGQLAPALDTQLGTISSRKGRRN